MTDNHNTFRLYSDLSWLWPIWGDPTVSYAKYCDHVVQLLQKHARRPIETLLNIACGGGKNTFNLKKHYRVTGVDISRPMLNLAEKLNPECEFLQGDMRSFSLGRTFDAILMDDGISYMGNRADLKAAILVAFQHLNPGGVMVAGPDNTTETFVQNYTAVAPAMSNINYKNIEVVFIENYYDPDPTDEHYEGTMLYLIRENGELRVETDRHILGLFSIDTWRQIFQEVGFDIDENNYAESSKEYRSFACVKP